MLNESQSLRKYSDQVLKICNVFPKNIFLLKKIFIMINLVNIGYGVGFSLAGYIDRSAHIENLRIFSVVNPPVTATFYAVYKKGKHLTKAALSLIDMVKMSVNEQFPFI